MAMVFVVAGPPFQITSFFGNFKQFRPGGDTAMTLIGARRTVVRNVPGVRPVPLANRRLLFW